MARKIKWGVLSTAKIAQEKIIPAMLKGKFTEITAIASRDLNKAQETAKKFGIPKAYGAYDELLHDGDIQAVYIPIHNHLHMPWINSCIED
ncbi:MAG: Gfo/Idh/MocA family oxidoreductase [Spirochaetota bacterium]|nr:MAG: Gfo/Idh/MocA family oxidoreductase [Spirochaetota bacterium]